MFEWAIKLATLLWGVEQEIAGLSPGDPPAVLPDILTRFHGNHYRIKVTIDREP